MKLRVRVRAHVRVRFRLGLYLGLGLGLARTGGGGGGREARVAGPELVAVDGLPGRQLLRRSRQLPVQVSVALHLVHGLLQPVLILQRARSMSGCRAAPGLIQIRDAWDDVRQCAHAVWARDMR